jgi:DNA-binding HxlR family transcriptional regulator
MDHTPHAHDDEHGGECPVVAAARVISGKWTLLVLRDLESGPKRFTELERSLTGISPRTLSQRLRALEAETIIDRQAYCETPPRVEYRLTAKGEALMPIVAAMRSWGEEWGANGVDEPGDVSPNQQPQIAAV